MATNDPTVEAQNAQIIINGTVTVLAGTGASAPGVDAAVTQQAQKNIERLRKRNAVAAEQERLLNAQFLDAKGKPLPEAKAAGPDSGNSPKDLASILGLASRVAGGGIGAKLASTANILNLVGGAAGQAPTLGGMAGLLGGGAAGGAAGAGAAAGAAGAAALGPLALVPMLADAVKDNLKKGDLVGRMAIAMSDAVGAGAEAAGNIGGAALAGNNVEAVKQTGAAFVDLAGKCPIAGDAIKAMGGAALQVVEMFQKLDAAISKRAGELSAYNAQLAVSSANAEITSLRRDIREANSLGPSMARYIDARASAEDRLAQILEPIKKFVIDKLATWLENFAHNLTELQKDGVEIRERVVAMEELFVAFATDGLPGAAMKGAELIKELPKRIAKAIKELDDVPDGDPWKPILDDLRDAARNGPMRPRLVPKDFPFFPLPPIAKR